jgi:hypothetical protein
MTGKFDPLPPFINNRDFWIGDDWANRSKNRPILNVALEDFWDTDEIIWEHYFSTSHCFLWDRYDVRYNPTDPDVIFCSIFTNNRPKITKKVPRVLLIHEPMPVQKNAYFDQFKAVISFTKDSDQPNNIRIPYWVYRLFDLQATFNYGVDRRACMLHRTDMTFMGTYSYNHFLETGFLKGRPEEHCDVRGRFCGFVAGKSVPWRDEVIGWLNEYRTVDCGGSLMANLPEGAEKEYMAQRLKGVYANEQKGKFLGDRKFGIAMENTMDMAGYTTEKIMDAYFAGCIPIYAGQMFPEDGFNPKAFVNLYDYDTKADFMARIVALDLSDHNEEIEMRQQPLFTKFPEQYTLDSLLDTYGRFFE